MTKEAENLAAEILANHPTWQDEERRRQDEKVEKDSERWEVGCEHR